MNRNDCDILALICDPEYLMMHRFPSEFDLSKIKIIAESNQEDRGLMYIYQIEKTIWEIRFLLKGKTKTIKIACLDKKPLCEMKEYFTRNQIIKLSGGDDFDFLVIGNI